MLVLWPCDVHSSVLVNVVQKLSKSVKICQSYWQVYMLPRSRRTTESISSYQLNTHTTQMKNSVQDGRLTSDHWGSSGNPGEGPRGLDIRFSVEWLMHVVNFFAIVSWPFLMARSKGVSPLSFFLLTSAPHLYRSHSHSMIVLSMEWPLPLPWLSTLWTLVWSFPKCMGNKC